MKLRRRKPRHAAKMRMHGVRVPYVNRASLDARVDDEWLCVYGNHTHRAPMRMAYIEGLPEGAFYEVHWPEREDADDGK